MLSDFLSDFSIQSYAKTIKSTNDILKKKLPFKINGVSESDEELFQTMQMWLQKLQFQINLKINYKYYKECKSFVKEAWKEQDQYYNEEEITEAAVKYAYYYAILDSRTYGTNHVRLPEIHPDKVWKRICFYCDNELKDDQNQCDVCESEEIEYKTIVEKADIKNESLGIQGIHSLSEYIRSSQITEDSCNVQHIPEGKEGQKETVLEKKWSCCKCSFLNSLDRANCQVCFEEPPTSSKVWKCGRCTFFNDQFASECKICLKTNDNVEQEPKYERDLKYTDREYRSGDEKEKKCWFKRCPDRRMIINNFCKTCGLDQTIRKRFGYKLKRRRRDGSIDSVWICSFCSKINNGSYDKCGWCQNDMLTGNSDARKCSCGWVNNIRRLTCFKCRKDLPQRRIECVINFHSP